MDSGLAWLFPGQGSQRVGMARDLAAQRPEAKPIFDQADAALGFSVSQLCWQGPEEALTATRNQQPALLTTCIAMFEVLRANDLLPEPQFVAGHSLGEYAALVASGSLALNDALHLVRRRGKLMEQHGAGGMIAILGLDEESVAVVASDSGAEIANYNSPGQIILSGTDEALRVAEIAATSHGARRVVTLPVNAAFHSSLMRPVAEELTVDIERTPVHPSNYPLVSNINATPLEQPDDIRAELINQIYQPVHWTRVIETMIQDGVGKAIEVGPGNVLAGLARRVDRSLSVQTAEQLLAG